MPELPSIRSWWVKQMLRISRIGLPSLSGTTIGDFSQSFTQKVCCFSPTAPPSFLAAAGALALVSFLAGCSFLAGGCCAGAATVATARAPAASTATRAPFTSHPNFRAVSFIVLQPSCL